MSTERYVNEVGNILHSITGTNNAARVQSEHKLVELLRRDAGDVLLLLAQIGAQGVGGFQLDHRLLALLLLFNSTFHKPLPALNTPPHHEVQSSGTITPGTITSDGPHTNPGVQVIPPDPFILLGETVKTRIELVLCSGLTDEQDPRLRKGIGECAGRWASGCWRYRRPCPHFPPILLQLTTSPLPFFRITPFQVLVIHPTLLSTSVAEPIAAKSLVQMITAGLYDPSTDVKVEAIRAMAVILDLGLSAKARDSLGPGLINSVFECLTRLPPSLLHHGFLPLVDLAWAHSALFVPCLPQVLPALVALLVPPTNLPEYPWSRHQPLQMSYAEWRENAQAAIELLLVFYEWQYKAITADEALRELEGEFAECLLAYECAEAEDLDINDVEAQEDLDDALVSLGRLTDATEGNRVWDKVLSHARILSRHDHWRCRYAAYMGLYTVLPSFREVARSQAEEILGVLENGAKDPVAAVRAAFSRTIGELYLAQAIHDPFDEGVLAAVTTLLDDTEPFVRSCAIVTLQDFLSVRHSSAVQARTSALVPQLLGLYVRDDTVIKQKVLHALPLAAWKAPSSFRPYTSEAFNMLLAAANDNAKSADLRASALGTITRISTAIGAEFFAPIAAQFAEQLLNLSQSDAKLRVGAPDLLLRTWIGFCEAVGAGFVSFLPIFMPQLLAACNDTQSATFAKQAQPTLWFTDHLDPAEVLTAVGRLAQILGQAMKPYLTPTIELAVRAIRSGRGGDAAAGLRVIPKLLRVAKDAHAWSGGPAGLAEILMAILGYLNRKLEYITQTAAGYDSFAESISIIGTMPPVEIVQVALQSANRHLGVIKGLREIRRTEYAEYDDEEKQYADEEQDEETQCLEGIEKAVVCLKELNWAGVRAGPDGDEKRRMFAEAVERAVGQIEADLRVVRGMGLDNLS